MAMSVGTSAGDTFCDINTTPLIDVMLVLLVTLIVTLPIMTHAVKLDMPNVTNPPPPPPIPPEVLALERLGHRGDQLVQRQQVDVDAHQVGADPVEERVAGFLDASCFFQFAL